MSKNCYQVSELNSYIERLIAEDFLLSNLTITGEVSNCKYNHTGHIYFTLKDDKSSIACVMFKGHTFNGLKFPMKDGDKVNVKGYVGIYAAAGKYQVYAKEITLAGLGDLHVRFEELKASLKEMGMFDDMYKKPIPAFAKRIGIVTAPTGAAVHDIIEVSKRRNPFVELILYPSQVQGEGAAQSIVKGIEYLDTLGLDVLIVGRGGGSIEDLWAFNEEIVAKAIFNCNTPIISAVGHDVDYTIADFVADRRAATPSQAAELANFEYEAVERSLLRLKDKADMLMSEKLTSYENRIISLNKQLKLLLPTAKLDFQKERFLGLLKQLNQAMESGLQRDINRLKVLSGSVDSFSPARKLSDGFGFITKD
ncbi:MAG: exodeoxyribonuclease VII large subunit, partial [Pseudobutyrivibrio sp.]|nr:exodeoxyribonuclease VII large subunit [Pseudobutyrivibrio sp.]